MNEDQLKEWLESIESDEILNLEVNLTEINQIIDDKTVKHIKARAFEKIQSSKKVILFKRKKRWGLSSLVAVLIVCFIPVTVFGVHYRYHFIPQLKEVIETKRPVYLLSEEQIDHEAVLKSFIYQSGKRVEATIEVEFINESNLQMLELDDLVIKLMINGDSYEGQVSELRQVTDDSDTLIKLGMTLEFKKFIPDYHKNDDIVLEVTIGDEYTYAYQVKELQNTLDGMSYEDLGPTSTKKELSITAISTETENELKINFVTPSLSSDELISYGRPFGLAENLEGGVILEDATGKVVKGEPTYDSYRHEEYIFNTEGLKKPYRLKLPSILVRYDLPANESIYTLNVPNDEMSFDETQTFFVNGFNVDMTSLELTDGPKDENGNLLNEGENRIFKVNVKFNELNEEGEWLLFLRLSDAFERNPLISGYQMTISPNGEGILYELYLNSKVSVLEFRFCELILEIDGNWEFFIE